MVYDMISNLIPFSTAIKSRDDGEFLVVAAQNHSIHYLNEVGKSFYEFIDNKRTISDIVKLICNEYDVENDIVENDILTLVRELQ